MKGRPWKFLNDLAYNQIWPFLWIKLCCMDGVVRSVSAYKTFTQNFRFFVGLKNLPAKKHQVLLVSLDPVFDASGQKDGCGATWEQRNHGFEGGEKAYVCL